MVIVSGATSAQIFLIKPVLDNIFANRDLYYLKWLPFVIVAVFFVKGAADYGQNMLMSYIGQRIVTDLRNELFKHIQVQPLSFLTKNPTGTLISRVTYDVNLIQGAVSDAVTGFFRDFFTLIGLIGVIFYHDWKFALLSLIIFPAAIYPIAKLGLRLRRIASSTQVEVGTLTSLLHETISGDRIVKAFGMEKYEGERFAAENEKLYKLVMKSVSVRAISSPLMEAIGGFGIALIIFYGGYQTINHASTPGTFLSLTAALFMLYEPIKNLTNVNNTIQQGISGAERVLAVINSEPEIKDKQDAIFLPPIKREIKLNNISFSYDTDPVLTGINLTINAGQKVAFAGMSGGGKTTLVNLIPRFYDINEGSIEIDGHDIRDVTLSSLRIQIGIVTQQPILFNDTVMNNIAYGDIRKSQEDIVNAAKRANAHDFIMRLPEAYDTQIGEQGAKLSGGERQRISIARALLKDAPILILDEATSSLDSEAEKEVQSALDNLERNRTTLVIAHRLSTIRNADRIIVLMNGKIVEEGTHESLLKKNNEYSKLFNLQIINNCDSTINSRDIARL